MSGENDIIKLSPLDICKSAILFPKIGTLLFFYRFLHQIENIKSEKVEMENKI